MMIVLLLGPAGSGKTTLCRLLEANYTAIKIYTTRERRSDDLNNYIFVDKKEFFAIYKNKGLLTKVKINDSFYGLKNEFNNDNILIAVGDYFTLQQIKKKQIEHISFFLDVPLTECERRLLIRGDDVEQIKKKIELERKWGEREKNMCDIIVESLDKKDVYEKVIAIIENAINKKNYIELFE